MIEIDFIIFEYLPLSEILRIFEFYFHSEIKGKKILNLKFGNQDLITETEQKYPVKVKCQYLIDPEKIYWNLLSRNPEAIKLLEANPDKIYWDWLSGNPKAIDLLEANPEKIYWHYLSKNPKAIHLLEANPDKIDWDWISKNPKAIHLLETII